MGLNLRPLHDRVLVERIDGQDKTKGGIFIPDSAKEKPLEGKVVAVGPGHRQDDGTMRPVSVKAGDRILFAKYAETEIKIEGHDYLLLRDDDILCIMQ